MWENMVKPDKPQMTIQRVRTVCWITKATHTHKHTETCNTYCFYTTAMVSRTRFNVTLYTCTLAVLSLPVMPSWYIRTNTQECWLSNTHQTNFFAEVWAICQVCCHPRSVNRYKGFGATCCLHLEATLTIALRQELLQLYITSKRQQSPAIDMIALELISSRLLHKQKTSDVTCLWPVTSAIRMTQVSQWLALRALHKWTFPRLEF